MRRFMRRALAASMVMAGVWLNAGGVLAAGNPGRTPNPPGPPVNVTCSGVPVVATLTFSKEYAKTYTLADGTIKVMVEGQLLATVAGNGKVLDLNSGGPGALFIRPDGSVTFVLEGHTLYITPTLDGIWLYTGHATFDGATGLVTSHTGHATDICALFLS